MAAPLSPPSAAKDRGRLDFRTRQLERRPIPELIVGPAIYAIEVLEVPEPVFVGDDLFNWMIPEDLDGAVLLKVEGYVNATSGGGDVEVMVTKVPDSGIPVDMLTDKIIIPAGELNSFEPGGEQSVVDPAEEEVVHGDHLRIDVDAAGTDARGLGVILYFIPLRSKALIVQGAKGDPGGVTAWTGEWQPATGYSEGESVSNNGSSYVAVQDHTSDTDDDEPGVGANWEDYWQLISAAQNTSGFCIIVNGNGFQLDTGLKGYVYIPFACEIVEATLLSSAAGDIEVDLWRVPYASHPPTDADSITGGNELVLSSADKTTNTALTGWTTALAEGDSLGINIDSVSGIYLLTIGLRVQRI
jgi:hypothetical protein